MQPGTVIAERGGANKVQLVYENTVNGVALGYMTNGRSRSRLHSIDGVLAKGYWTILHDDETIGLLQLPDLD